MDTACGKDTIEMEKNKNLLIGHSADIGGTGLEHLVNSIPGGIASYLIKRGAVYTYIFLRWGPGAIGLYQR